MIKNTIALLLLLFPILIYSQTNVSGRIVDEKNTAVEFAEIILINGDSTAVKNEMSDSEGRFLMNIPVGNYLLQIKQLGFIKFHKNINANEAIDLGTIQISTSQALEEVVVENKKKLIERKVDRLIFNVENSISVAGGDALDALKATPGIRVQNEKIIMVGKGNIVVMIDDKIMQLSNDDLVNLLKTIPADNISKIEVITTPPAKYEASGNSGMINIVTKKVKKDSWNAATGVVYTQRKYSSEGLNGSFNYNKNKLTVQSSANVGQNHNLYIDRSRTYYESELWSERTPRNIENKFATFRIGADYDITSKWSTGILYLGSYSKSENNDNSLSTRTDNATANVNSYLSSVSESTSEPKLNSLNWHSAYKLDTIGRKISIDLDYFDYKNFTNRDYNGNELDTNKEIVPNTYFAVINSNGNNITNYSGKVDVEYPMSFVNLTFGGRISHSSTDNNVVFYNNETGTPELDPLQTNNFEYLEKNQALYLSGSRKINEKWEAQAGLRMEATQTEGYSAAYDQLNKNNYVRYFPTAYITYKPNENHNFSFNYSRRIRRPNYEQLNPFRIYANPFNYNEGNPFLLPSFSDLVEFNYGYKNFDAKLSYYKGTNIFEQVAIIDTETNISRFYVLNFLKTHSYGLSLNNTQEIFKWWTSVNSFFYNYSWTTSKAEFSRKNIDGSYSGFSTSNDFLIDKEKTFSGNISFWYDFPGIASLDEYTVTYGLSCSLRYLVLDKNLQISLTTNDLLKSHNPTFTSYSNGIKQQYKNYFDSQYFRIALRYKFGNSKLQVNTKEFGNAEESNRVN